MARKYACRYQLNLWSMVGMVVWLISQPAFAQYQYAAWPPEVQPATKPFANAGRLLNEAGRFWGVGYSEGYHACPTCSSGTCSMQGKHQHGYPQLLNHLHPKLNGKNIVASNAPACSQCGNASCQGHHACNSSRSGTCGGSCQSNCGHHPPGVDQAGSASPFFWRSNVRYFHPSVAIPSSIPSGTYGHAAPIEHAAPAERTGPAETGSEGYVPNHMASPSDHGTAGNATNPWQHAQPLPGAAEEVLRELPLPQAPALGQPRIPQAAIQPSRQLVPPVSGAVPTARPNPAPALSLPAEQLSNQLIPDSTGASGNVRPQAANPIPRPPLPAKELSDSSEDLLDEGEATTPGKSKEISLLEPSGDAAEGDRPAEVSKDALLLEETKKQDQVVPGPPASPTPPEPAKSPEVKPTKDSEKIPAEEDLLSRRRNIIRQPTRR